MHVAIFEMDASDKRVLDGIEGVGAGYLNASLSVPGFGDCATYLAEDAYVDESLRPYEWYKKLVQLGARAQRFPRHYLQTIDDIPASQDPDPVRGAANWRIVEAIECDSRQDLTS